jgi:hypothetical protein
VTEPGLTTPKYQVMPVLSDEDETALRESIREHGVRQPILIDEDGAVIDGHHRQRIAAEEGKPCPSETIEGLTEDEKRALAWEVNYNRRHLTAAQRRSLLENLVKAELAKGKVSDRMLGKRFGVDHKTIAVVRTKITVAKLHSGEHSPKTTKPKTPKSAPTVAKSRSIKDDSIKPPAPKDELMAKACKAIRYAAEVLGEYLDHEDRVEGKWFDDEIGSAIGEFNRVATPFNADATIDETIAKIEELANGEGADE